MNGQLPSELGQLSELRILHLYRNRLSGSIPSELGSLRNVRDLSLGGNEISGSIPPEIGNCRALEFIYFDNNRLTGRIPETLDNLTNLRVLFIHNNDLEGPLPPRLRSLPPSASWEPRFDRENEVGFVPTSSPSSPPSVSTTGTATPPPTERAEVPVVLIVSLVVGGIVLIIVSILIIIYLRNRADKRLSKRYSEQRFSHPSEQTLFQFNPSISASPRPISTMTNTVPPILNQGIPDRIYFFSQGNGIVDFMPILDYIFYPTLLPVSASKPYMHKYPDEIDVTTGDSLIVTEHTYDGWCRGYNQTQNTEGLFPLMCTTPRHPMHLLLVDTRSPLEVFPEKDKVEGAKVSFPQYVSTKFVFDYPTLDEVRSSIQGKEEEHIQCFISGSHDYIDYVQSLLENLVNEGYPIPPPARFTSV
jgi:hypothetical protein